MSTGAAESSGAAGSPIADDNEVDFCVAASARVLPPPIADEFCERGGSTCIAVLIGVPSGRWTPELDGQPEGCKEAREALAASGTFPLAADCPGVVVGVVAFRGWKCVSGAASHAQTFALMRASEHHHARRSGHRFVEHEILAAAKMSPGFGGGQLVAERAWLHERSGSHRMNRDASSALGDLSADITKGDLLGYSFAVRDVVDRWRESFSITSEELVAWPVDYRLATQMASGSWWGDVSVKHRRQLPLETTMAPVRPSDKVLRHFLAHRVDRVFPPVVQCVGRVWDDKKFGAARSYHAEHIVASARACAAVSDKAKLKQNLMSALQWWAPGTWQSIASGPRKLENAPAANSQRRHIIRMDIASMLYRRQWYKSHGPTFRYVAFDASPQHGHEYFVSVERVVKRVDVQQLSDDQSLPPVESRVLPLSTLGCGRMGLADKVQTHVHQVWLEYGPSLRSVRAANLDVRQCLSDMGTELAIGDASDCVASCIGQKDSSGGVKHLYPLALVVPGPQHILDTSLTRGLEALHWWPEWQRSAKVMCQWLRPANRRASLGNLLRDAGADELPRLLKALEKSCDSFAAWRWKTLGSVTADLSRLEDPVRCVLLSVSSAAQLSSRDGGSAAAFVESGRDPQFWERNAMLRKMTCPITAFSAWLRGCPCHEDDRLRGRKIDCQWAGCRAPFISSRLEVALTELQGVRDEFYMCHDIVAAVNTVLGNLRMKMAWVWEEPYIVWRAHDPSVAQQLLDTHDAMISQGKEPHRVTSYLCAVSGSLRADMVAHAGGAGLSDRLRVELRAYQMCKLDDTWAESVHRDVSCLTKRTCCVTPMYVAAKQRLPQTLASVDNMAPDAVAAYYKCLRRVKAIGQLKAPRAAALVPARKPLKAILGQVYRCDESALRNWGSELSGVLCCLASSSVQRKRDTIERLQIEYLSSAVIDGQLLSLPAVSETVLDRVDEARPSQRGAILLDAQEGETFFIVVDKAAGRKKTLKTSSCILAQMALPVTLQRVSRARGASESEASACVYHDGCPELVDLLPLASWNVWRFGLCKLSAIASATPGCLVLCDREPLVPSGDWQDPSAPTLRLLEELVGLGWSRGSPPKEHTVDSPKLFKIADPVAAKAYIRCLLAINDLFARDIDFAALPSAEPDSYYQLVLLSDKPSQVARGQSPSQYRVALKALADGDVGKQSLAAIEDAAPPDPPSPADSGIDFCTPWVSPESRGAKRKAGSAAKREPKQKQSRKRRASDWQAIVCAESTATTVPIASVPAPAPAASSSDPAGSAFAAHGAAAQAAVVEASVASGSREPSGAPAVQVQRVGAGVRDTDRGVVEGVEVSHEAHGVLGTPGSYRRLIVTCPHHSGKPCRKKRNYGVRAAAVSGLGDAEPHAFLGAWLRAHAEFDSSEAHCRYTPSAAAVISYAREIGLVAAPEGPAD